MVYRYLIQVRFVDLMDSVQYKYQKRPAAQILHGSQESLKQYLASELQIGDRGEGGEKMLVRGSQPNKNGNL